MGDKTCEVCGRHKWATGVLVYSPACFRGEFSSAKVDAECYRLGYERLALELRHGAQAQSYSEKRAAERATHDKLADLNATVISLRARVAELKKALRDLRSEAEYGAGYLPEHLFAQLIPVLKAASAALQQERGPTGPKSSSENAVAATPPTAAEEPDDE